MQPWAFKSPSFQTSHKKKYPHTPNSGNPRLLFIYAATVATTMIIMFYLWRTIMEPKHLCSPAAPLTAAQEIIAAEFDTTASPLVTILHYATARGVPQQSKFEMRRPFDVLQSLAPCNFLVFGIGHDSLMWDSFNPRGNTVFLEEDPKWTLTALKRFPILRAYSVRYNTRLSDANTLLSSYKKECDHATADGHLLKGNRRCRLALSDLPDEVYNNDWDVILIDGPKGYFAAAPGRMSVIYTAAMMARERKKSGVTHVFLHDVDREVEQRYAKEFLCMKYRVGGIRKLWHFVIPPVANASDFTRGFCS